MTQNLALLKLSQPNNTVTLLCSDCIYPTIEVLEIVLVNGKVSKECFKLALPFAEIPATAE